MLVEYTYFDIVIFFIYFNFLKHTIYKYINPELAVHYIGAIGLYYGYRCIQKSLKKFLRELQYLSFILIVNGVFRNMCHKF